jgi:hypothetical protein
MGRGEKVGWATLVLGRQREKKRGGKGKWAGEEKRERVAGLGREREEREGFGKFSFFFFSNLFKTLNLNSFQNFQNILKTYKTSHKQAIKPCIQIMMHKHLLLLNY